MRAIRNHARPNDTFTKIEFWAASTIFVFIMFFFIIDGLNGDSSVGNLAFKNKFIGSDVYFNFYRNYFYPQLVRYISLFITLMYLNFMVIPALVKRESILLNILKLIVVIILSIVIFGITDSYLKEFAYDPSHAVNANYRMMFYEGVDHAFTIFGVFAIYSLIKYISQYLIKISSSLQAKYPFIRREGTVASIIWAIGLLLIVITGVPRLFIAGWVIAIPSAILLYEAGFYTLIPTSLNKKYPFITYAFKNAVILFIVLLAWGLILRLVVGGVLGGDKAPLAALWIFNSVLQMFITVPITWLLYKRQMKGDEQMNVLKKELGQSNANFDFLRSQINPHFLFNALNTIYGTALQEGADRTGEAVQKLGDMMRFMLQENMEEKISLKREIDYLENYISLQKLRTDANPMVQIETNILHKGTHFQLAPMLLIPFVENAFKHGISFREQSTISLKLEVKDRTLNFEVYNSKHAAQPTDPEKNKSGIGLENVKQRLELLYPGKHELIIKESSADFFVHLRLQMA